MTRAETDFLLRCYPRSDYGGIDTARIWLLVIKDLPSLKADCRDALRRLEGGGPA